MTNEIKNEKGESLEEFIADSGMVCVVLLQEASDYVNNPDNQMPPFYQDLRNFGAIIRNFEGEVTLDTSDKEWTVVRGKGNINFNSKVR